MHFLPAVYAQYGFAKRANELIDHVGLGSSFDGMGTPSEGLEAVGKIATLTHELVKRGYSEADIKKVLGGNLLRVFAENEKNSKSHSQ
jgi:membrane dipeptidase